VLCTNRLPVKIGFSVVCFDAGKLERKRARQILTRVFLDPVSSTATTLRAVMLAVR
jgi:hypothetical protein